MNFTPHEQHDQFYRFSRKILRPIAPLFRLTKPSLLKLNFRLFRAFSEQLLWQLNKNHYDRIPRPNGRGFCHYIQKLYRLSPILSQQNNSLR